MSESIIGFKFYEYNKKLQIGLLNKMLNFETICYCQGKKYIFV